MSYRLSLEKKNKIWIWTAATKHKPGILEFVIGHRNAETFKNLWRKVGGWKSFFYVTDNYVVYKMFIDEADHLISKTYMTRIEGENTRLRHYLARLHRKTLCYSKSAEMLKLSVVLLIYFLRYKKLPMFSSTIP